MFFFFRNKFQNRPSIILQKKIIAYHFEVLGNFKKIYQKQRAPLSPIKINKKKLSEAGKK